MQLYRIFNVLIVLTALFSFFPNFLLQYLLSFLLFSTLISTTDPVAVLAILKNAHVPKSLEMNIAGELLLNDGIAVVVFLSIYLKTITLNEI